jgi:stringent starvation protein B
MKEQRPYLLRALYDWIVDSDTTPYLLVTVDSPEVKVPAEFVSDGRIVLNVSPRAVRSLSLGNDRVEFDGRFSGRQFWVSVPVSSIAAIYARETGQGMAFEASPDAAQSGLKLADSEEADAQRRSGSGSDSGGWSNQANRSDAKPSGTHLKIIK